MNDILNDKIRWRRKFKDFPEDIFDLEIALHPNDSGRIIINYPGADGDIDGYNKKYETLANHIQNTGLAAVARSGNPYIPIHGWTVNLRELIAYSIDNSKKICGSTKPEIWLMGFSAGAGAIGTIAWEYPEITKILLCAPAKAVGEEELFKNLEMFTGEAYIVVGDKNEVIPSEDGQRIHDALLNSKHRELIVIPNCDHQFQGEENGRILSQVPFYAFGSEKNEDFPNPKSGIKLY